MFSRTPWEQITRAGIPDFMVVRRALGPDFPIGAAMPQGFNRSRLRQLYEQRRIEVRPLDPVTAPQSAESRKKKR